MNSLKRPLLGILLAAAVLSLIGCASNPQGGTIPWSRPASWENQIPGMGSQPGLGR